MRLTPPNRFTLPWLCAALLTAACDVGALPPGGGGGGDDDDDTVDPGGGPDGGGAVGADGRVTSGLVALYTFREGLGGVVRDVSGVGAPLDLAIADPATVGWLPDGLVIGAPTLIVSPGPAAKVIDACRLSGELTVEAWLRAAPVQDEGAGTPRILTVSGDTQARDFTLAQSGDAFQFRLRTTATDDNGQPAVETGPAVLGTIQHVVYTRSTVGAATFYLNGSKQVPQVVAENFTNWDLTYRLAIANEVSADRPWLGQLHLVAIYCRELSEAEIQANLVAGY